MGDELTPLERDVLAALLQPDHPVINALRRQLVYCRVALRELTGVGFFSTLQISPEVQPAPVKRGRMTLGDVTAAVEGLEHGAGFVLFVQNGVLDLLEGFSYDEPWTDVDAQYQITAGGVFHSGGGMTDIEQASEAWLGPGDINER
jgi:hypothetical protein